LFLGATVGVPFINFTENFTYLEKNDKDPAHKFIHWNINDVLNVRATGINLKLGAIYQPVDFLRVGVAFHTPTFYGTVRDNFERTVDVKKWDYTDSLLNTKIFNDKASFKNRFNYALTTPLRVMLNAAFFIKQRAFISAEYEFADYSMANMYSVSYSFREENNAIQKKYGGCHIARIGAEYNINQVFAVRAGYNYISSPYKDKINDGSQHYVSAGFGFRTKYFYSDFAYTVTTSKEKYWMYDPMYVNEANNKYNAHRILLTVGVKF
jgi:long-subunit fatty acid transport protein